MRSVGAVRLRALAVVAGTLALAGGAWSSHPQGNVARLVPFVLLESLLLIVLATVTGGARRGALVAALLGAAGAISVLVYVVAIEPIPFAECGTIAEELGGSSGCTDHASSGIALLAVGALVASIGVAFSARPRGGRPIA